MVSVQKVEDGVRWGSSVISIILSLLFTMVRLTILKPFHCGEIRLTVTAMGLSYNFHISSSSDTSNYSEIIVVI